MLSDFYTLHPALDPPSSFTAQAVLVRHLLLIVVIRPKGAELQSLDKTFTAESKVGYELNLSGKTMGFCWRKGDHVYGAL